MSEKNVTFILLLIDDAPDRFLLVRNVNDYSTHYLGPDGMWIAWPEHDEELAELFETINDNADTMLPKFDTDAAEDINESLGGEDDHDS